MTKHSDQLLVLFGNQLFDNPAIAATGAGSVFMAESATMCHRYRAHQHKLVLILSGMRSKADALRKAGYEVHYTRLGQSGEASFATLLARHLRSHEVAGLHSFETESPDMSQMLSTLCEAHGLHHHVHPSPMFLTTRDALADYRGSHKRLFMAEFYTWQRKRLDVLLDENGTPVGGKWSFDEDNRKKLPKGHTPPPLHTPRWTNHTKTVVAEVSEEFPEHPGDAKDFWLPTTKRQAEAALDSFLEERFQLFGDYEDALSTQHRTLYHSVLSPLLNVGLLRPDRVLERALRFSEEHGTPINSVEGFVRQIIGWREFIRGVWHLLPQSHWAQNFWGHSRVLTDDWYEGTTGIPPLDDAISRARETGYNHHIERLMVVGNLMLLCRVAPAVAYDWFMEMYVDSADWVMAPNVYGMALFSEGGAFTTKPYICGSNYIRKMSDYGKGPWCDVVDGLYWRFVDDYRDFFSRNPRSKMMLGTLERMAPDRKARIYASADAFMERYTS
jgi:deoxyribodipyrimidine photolyase-related protein